MISMRRAGGPTPPLFFATFTFALFLPTLVFAFDKPKAYLSHPAPKVAPELEDAYELLYLGKPRPVWFRLHVRADGKPFAQRWERYMDALFNYLDVNGDGFLDAKECERLPPVQMFQLIIQGGYLYPSPGTGPVFALLDTNLDGRVSREELAAFYAKKVNPVRFQPVADPDPYADSINRALFQLFDAKGGGKLTRTDLADAEKLLDKYDLDEDECLTVQEIVPGVLNRAVQNQNRTPPNLNQYLLLRPGDPVSGLAQRFLAVYDLDKDYHLSREECPLDAALFNRLDRDGNGQLDVPELADFFAFAVPDVEAWLTIEGQSPVATLSRFAARPNGANVKTVGKSVRVRMTGGESLDLGEPAMPVADVRTSRLRIRQVLVQLFNSTAGAKGYITAKDVQMPNTRSLEPYFRLADRDGDGRLTLDELDAFIDLHAKLPEATLTLSAFRQSTNWFSVLDVNHDGRLSRRELRDAWKSLAAIQESPGDTIAAPEKEERLQWVIHHGANVFFNASLVYLNPPAARVSGVGPLWFRKMDRNGDGFVSRREFLGTKEEFDRIDRDGDGLIDPDEAARATPRK